MKLLSSILIKNLFPDNVVEFLSVLLFVFLAMAFYSILFFLISNRIFRNKPKKLFDELFLHAIPWSLSITSLAFFYVKFFSNWSNSSLKKELFSMTFGVGNSIKTFLFGISFFEHSDFFDISLYFIMIAILSNVISNLLFLFFQKYQ
ncbi:hypothetical protein MT996_11560 [Ornithobacterium rhinotracheale]|uniref:hypothetical protein n=1 Tax=Ornithobacterium rhinotracheale TaxID=28251 RepID=UPI00129D01E7|nr:hypothetical protein [Ornithobacterium rhinotracheale]UOH77823.1 hypothetical protein MT996_11560 [Ornithobacterium rhinotracheale]